MTLFALSAEELTERLGGVGRAKAVWSALRAGRDPFADPGLPAGARRRLRDACPPTELALKETHVADDQTVKLLFELADARAIEAVLIPHEHGRTTLCISTQVGCARGCTFCLTAAMKLVRNLEAAEIVAEVAAAIKIARERAMPPLRNLVLMGMGEPLDNLDAVAPALAKITNSAFGLGVGPARITLSTVGPSPRAILAARDLPARIAWSLHAAEEATRRSIVPTMRHTVLELRDAFAALITAREEPLFVEMTMIDGVNDGDRDAEAAIELFRGFPGEVRFNLLPMNPIGSETMRASTKTHLFEQKLRGAGYFTMVRRARGESERAACGQLIVLRAPSAATTTPRTAP